MFALGIEFLTGRYVATAYSDRRRPEWPPHPARVFSALVATHFEDPDRDPGERDALRWLEAQPAPEIHGTDARARDPYDVFVPVNDPSVVETAWREHADVESARATLAAAATDKDATRARKELEKAAARLAGKLARAVAPFEGAIPAETLELGESLLPDRRGKQARNLPSVVPDEPRVALVWPAVDAAPEISAALDRLAARVVRLGHSSSLVSMRVMPHGEVRPRPYRVPDPDGEHMLRGVAPGQLDRLCEDFERHRGVEPRVMPAAMHGYAPPRAEPPEEPQSVFGTNWIVLACVDAVYPTSRSVDIARATRNALQRFSPLQPAPEIISGHGSASAPSQQSHLAVVPLPHVGYHRADGLIRGVGLILPRGASAADRNAVLRAVGAWEAAVDRGGRVPILLPGGVELEARRVTDPASRALQSARWCDPARVWATVTPIALDRHPGDLQARNPAAQAKAIAAAADTVGAACEHIGLPRPHVEIVPAAPIAGVIKTRQFPPYPPVAGRTRRALVHAVLTFDQPVAGPLLLGAGRYHGLGLLCPCDGESA